MQHTNSKYIRKGLIEVYGYPVAQEDAHVSAYTVSQKQCSVQGCQRHIIKYREIYHFNNVESAVAALIEQEGDVEILVDGEIAEIGQFRSYNPETKLLHLSILF